MLWRAVLYSLSPLFASLYLAVIFGAGNPLLMGVTAICAAGVYWRDKYTLLRHSRVPALTKARLSAVVRAAADPCRAHRILAVCVCVGSSTFPVLH